MYTCDICSSDFILVSNVTGVVNCSQSGVIDTIKNFATVERDDFARDNIFRVITPYFESSAEFICNDRLSVRVCNPCLVRYRVIDTVKKEYFESLGTSRFLFAQFRAGLIRCSCCSSIPPADAHTVCISVPYGMNEDVNQFISTPVDERDPALILDVARTSFNMRPGKFWYIMSIPRDDLVFCPNCIVPSHGQTPEVAPETKEESNVPAEPESPRVAPETKEESNVPAEPESPQPEPEQQTQPSVTYLPYVWKVQSDTEHVGSLNEGGWKVCLIATGQESSMWSVHRYTSTLKPVDWRTTIDPAGIRPLAAIQNDLIVARLESILNPVKQSLLSNTENRYARYLLEASNFAQLDIFDLKLYQLFKTLLCIHVTAATFPAFRAVYVGLWNLCTSDQQRSKIAKLTLHLLRPMSYRSPIYKLLSQSLNLLSLYNHEAMFREPTEREQIWFENYKYLKHIAEMRQLEAFMDPPAVPAKKCAHRKIKDAEIAKLCSNKKCPAAPKKERFVYILTKEKPACARVLFPEEKSDEVPTVEIHDLDIEEEC